MFFPPSPIPNSRAYVSDDKYFEDMGVKRFGAFDMPCTIYWPWLSWDTIDTIVDPNQQSAMPRAQLIGAPPTLIFGIIPDGVGSIVRFGHPEAMQAWEVIHYFDYLEPETPYKKLVLLWCRLFVPAPPPPAVPINASGSWATAPTISSAVLYSVANEINPAYLYVVEPSAGQYHVEAASATGKPSMQVELFHSVLGEPGLLHAAMTPADFTVSNSASHVGLRLTSSTPQETQGATFRVTKL